MSDVNMEHVFHFIREARRHIDLMYAYTDAETQSYHYQTAQRAVDAISNLYTA